MTDETKTRTERPLTYKIRDQIQDSVHPCDPENMRAAADWQLEQVVRWIEANLSGPQGNRRPLYVFDNVLKTYKEFDYEFIDRLTQEMHPQEDNL